MVSSQDFNKKKPAQEKAMNDIVRDGQKLIDEDIVPSDKREAVEFDLQSLPETWNGIVAKADENKKTYVVENNIYSRCQHFSFTRLYDSSRLTYTVELLLATVEWNSLTTLKPPSPKTRYGSCTGSNSALIQLSSITKLSPVASVVMLDQ